MVMGSGDGADSLGYLLRGWRRASRLTQAELASRAGLSVAAVRDLEQGRTMRPSSVSLAGLARALGLSPAQLGELERAGTAGGLSVQVLGPLRVWRGGAAVQLAGAGRQAVLGLLALSAGSPVHRDGVIDVLWPDGAPARAVHLVQAHVSRLWRLLDPGGAGPDVVASEGEGYRLQAGPGEVDLLLAQKWARAARAASATGDEAAACELYRQAVELWRGEPVADVELLAPSRPASRGATQNAKRLSAVSSTTACTPPVPPPC